MRARNRAIALERLESREVPTGAVDASFGTNGSTLVQFGAYDALNTIIRQADGNYLAAGSTYGLGNDDFVMARLDRNGALDPSFGDGGKVRTDLGHNDAIVSILPQGDRFLAVGASVTGLDSDLAIARYDWSGKLDPTFGTGGFIIHGFGHSESPKYAVLAGDKIVVCGQWASNSVERFGIWRFNASDGSVDTLFGTGGEATVDFGFGSLGNTAAMQLTVLANGKIVVAGHDRSEIRVVRLTSSGTLDPMFGGGDGIAEASIPGQKSCDATSMVVLDNGTILVAGSALNNNGFSGDIALARFTSAGLLDTTFDGDGMKAIDLGSTEHIQAITIQPTSGRFALGVGRKTALAEAIGFSIRFLYPLHDHDHDQRRQRDQHDRHQEGEPVAATNETCEHGGPWWLRGRQQCRSYAAAATLEDGSTRLDSARTERAPNCDPMRVVQGHGLAEPRATHCAHAHVETEVRGRTRQPTSA
jgi:uncharacterized delta-60 repeat protein